MRVREEELKYDVDIRSFENIKDCVLASFCKWKKKNEMQMIIAVKKSLFGKVNLR